MRKSDWTMILGVTLLIFVISFFQLKIGQMKTRDAQRKADVELVARALRAFKEDHKKLPIATIDGKIISCGRNGSEICEWGDDAIVDEQNVVYMNKLPVDPFEFKFWKYVYDGKRIYILLENLRDVGIRKGLTMECADGLQCNWYVEI